MLGKGLRARQNHAIEGRVSALKIYFYLVQVIISVSLIAIILIQAKGAGGLGGLFGGSDGSVYKSRRGFEKTIYQITIGLTVAFFLFSLLTVMVA